jgi:flagellar biosynthesis protein FliR
MPDSILSAAGFLDWDLLARFLLTLTRLGLAFVFVPLPGVRSAPEMVRALLIVSMAAAVVPLLPASMNLPASPAAFAWALAGEAVYGLAVGVVVALLSEVLTFAMQAFALQAGYSYASSIDPNSDADSGVLLILALLVSNLLFFALGGHHLVIRAFATSLEVWPVGGAAATIAWGDAVRRLGGSIFELSVRLALPVAGLLLLAEIALGVVSRIQSQLQLLSLAFPIKMLGTLAALAALAPMWVAIYRRAFDHSAATLEGMLRR